MANYEQLFLLEVLVDRLKLLTTALAAFAPEDDDEPDTPLRIRVKFSDFPCFEITQDLAPPDKDDKNGDTLTTPIVFSSGKSCMFPMDPEQLIQDLIKYPMAVTVFKKNTDSPLPDIIGQTKVPLGDYMHDIIKKAAEWSLEEPISELIQDTFMLKNSQEQDVGTINMLIRLTCFGKTIITKFQIADNKKSFLFKNAKTQDYEFKCKKCMPGQPIMRPPPPCPTDEDGNWDEEGMMGDTESGGPCLDKELMTDFVPEKQCPGNKETHTSGPGFQRHEVQGPGFTASMEVRYPEDREDNLYGGMPHSPTGPYESMSTPMVKKDDKPGKEKPRGKSLEPKKVDIENGVKLEKPRKKKRSRFHVEPGIAYPGVILGHKHCVSMGAPVPARNGWAWRTTIPEGMKWEQLRGWRPGCVLKPTWKTMKEVEEIRKMGKKRRIKRRPVLPDTRKTTVHIHRLKGIYHVTMHPIPGPDDKEEQEPIVYTLDRPEDGSDASEIELDLTVPDPPYPEPFEVKHQAQQFCEEDLPLILPKPFKIKKKKKPPPPAIPPRKAKPSSAKSKASAISSKDKGKGKGKDYKGRGKGKSKPGKGPKGKGGKGSEKSRGKTSAKKDQKPSPSKSAQKKKKKKGDDDDDVFPWDDWIMKLRCKHRPTPDDL